MRRATFRTVRSSTGKRVPVAPPGEKQRHPAEVSPVADRTARKYARLVDGPVRDTVLTTLTDTSVPLARERALRVELRDRLAEHEPAMQSVFRTALVDAANRGAAAAARLHNIDLPDDEIGIRLTRRNELEAAGDDFGASALDTLAADVARKVRQVTRKTQHDDSGERGEAADAVDQEVIDDRHTSSKAEEHGATTAHSGDHAGRNETFLSAEGIIGEEWVAVLDDRTRDEHESTNGQIVPVDKPFLLAGGQAEHPGDPTLPPEQSVNCRCTMVPVHAGELEPSEEAQLVAGQRLSG